MDYSLLNASPQESDADLADLAEKKRILNDLVGGKKYYVFRAAIAKEFPDNTDSNELIQKYLLALLHANDLQSLQLLNLEGLPSFILLARKQLLPVA